ncbi:MAG TPA: sulfate ABC transporter permease subunit CysW [bacterium]
MRLGEKAGVRVALTAAAIGFLMLFLFLPLLAVFGQAFQKGWAAYAAALREPDARAAMQLTLLVTGIVVPMNTIFGLAAAWAISRFTFRGKSALSVLIALPLAVSPVIAGLIFVLLFGQRGVLGPFLAAHDVRIIFAVPGIVLATLFVTFPLVAREVIPIMEAQGKEQEEAAVVLGASGWQTFLRVTLPGIRWGLLYGIVLCAARAMGEFGAVSVVSGHIRGLTNTVPLYVEIVYNEYNFAGAFAVASTLMVVALLTIVLKTIVEWRGRIERTRGSEAGTG